MTLLQEYEKAYEMILACHTMIQEQCPNVQTDLKGSMFDIWAEVMQLKEVGSDNEKENTEC